MINDPANYEYQIKFIIPEELFKKFTNNEGRVEFKEFSDFLSDETGFLSLKLQKHDKFNGILIKGTSLAPVNNYDEIPA